MQKEKAWWKEAVIYQIYPRSFYDSNSDGIGDLKGITEKLDYLKWLGINVIWLCPIYRSPNDDNRYDISDYYDIMPEFGTMADFEKLLEKAHRLDLKIIMDLVVNHTSFLHKCFLDSRSSKESDKRDYYIWRGGKNGGEPNNWASFFTPSAWEYDQKTGEYYLHLFSKKQPDLNWENADVRNSVYKMMAWWLDKGIDGFRMDVINCISKKPGLPDVEPSDGGYKWAGKFFMNGPKVHEYLREMNEKVLSKYDIMTVGETPGVTPKDALFYAGSDAKELNMVFESELMDIDSGESGKWEIKKWTLCEFKKIIGKWQKELYGKAWNSIFLGNHDQPRIVSRFGNDGAYHAESAKLLATLILTLNGTPYIFEGDEIGMTNMPFKNKDECRDIEAINFYESAVRSGKSSDEVMACIRAKSRDNARTPMQWNDKDYAGFSKSNPWIGVNPNYKKVNVEKEMQDKNSILEYYRKMIKTRQNNPVLIYGSYQPVDAQNEDVMAYIRKLENKRILVILNFSLHKSKFSFPEGSVCESSRLLIGNLKEHLAMEKNLELEPYEALVIQL